MQPYFMNFHVKGEVAGTLLLNATEPKLLVDLSPECATREKAPGFKYPNRVSFTICNPDLIKRFQKTVALGDVIEAHGAFVQSGYVPHGNRHVDTTFEMRSFQQRSAKMPELSHGGQVFQMRTAGLPN
ncbi:hypothetical protein BXY66_2273 [Shimia isoporae]|uniref:Single-stranded DNA-binding protein n=1 Tax=Shimia isoporae TaxID=647720 RepID=A0A4R1NPC0_9RHOB|nr:hypothetical protein [Shimia isoporae]TCL10204.1 hypothetical protein BXY66_2273 [Shimia isoporae]